MYKTPKLQSSQWLQNSQVTKFLIVTELTINWRRLAVEEICPGTYVPFAETFWRLYTQGQIFYFKSFQAIEMSPNMLNIIQLLMWNTRGGPIFNIV